MTAPHQTPAEQRIIDDLARTPLEHWTGSAPEVHQGDTGHRPSVEQWIADEVAKTARKHAAQHTQARVKADAGRKDT